MRLPRWNGSAIGSGVILGLARQVLNGGLNVALIALASRYLSHEDFTMAINVTVVGALACAWGVMPFYPGIYSFLSGNQAAIRSVALKMIPLILLGGLLAAISTAIYLSLWDPLRLIPSIYYVLMLSMSITLPSFPLSLGAFAAFNTLELLPAATGLVLLYIFGPHTFSGLLCCLGSGFLLKNVGSLVWVAGQSARSEASELNVVPRREILLTGGRIGLSGASQTFSFRAIYLVLQSQVALPYVAAVALTWPLCERILVIPQAINAISFGAIRRGELSGRAIVGYLMAGVMGALIVWLGGLGIVAAWGARIFGANYGGALPCLFALGPIFIIHSVRIMLQSVINAKGSAMYIIVEGLVLSGLLYFLTLSRLDLSIEVIAAGLFALLVVSLLTTSFNHRRRLLL